jgi:DNA-binding LytR/AlgR family response regulator
MIKTVIIEDETIIADYLEMQLREIDPAILVVARLTSVEESVQFFSENNSVELIFCDVQLRDGHSFSIFETVPINIPIIFVTAYDTFVLKAFEKNGIEYLLKPVTTEDLTRAVEKYKALKLHFAAHLPKTIVEDIRYNIHNKAKTRILAKKGNERLPLLLSDIVFFYTKNKVVLAFDSSAKRYIIDKTLSDLEAELDPQQFFRANRQYLLNIDYIRSFKPYEKVKLWVELSVDNIEHTIIISQVTTAMFRTWLEKA